MSAHVIHEPGEIVVYGAGTASNARRYATGVLDAHPAAVANLSRARKDAPMHGLSAWRFTYPAVALGEAALRALHEETTRQAADLIDEIASAADDAPSKRAHLERLQSRQRALVAILNGLPR